VIELDPLEGLLARYEMPTVSSDPVKWAQDVLKTETYSKQREIIRLVDLEVPKIAVPSCHSAGKSKTASIVAARWLAKYPPGTARVVTTAPTFYQVQAVLWNEINALFAKAVDDEGNHLLPGRVNQTQWWINGYLAGMGRKPADNSPETFSGLHAEHLLVIIDEAGGVPNEIWHAVSTLATNEGCVILAIGNPDDPQSFFKEVVEGAQTAEGNGWTVVQIPAWETPNLSGEPCAGIFKKVLLTKQWVEEARKAHGEDSGWWASKVAAEFPDEDSMTIIRVVDVTASMNCPDDYDPEDLARYKRLNQVQLGVDIAASETGDETVIRERVGRKILRRWSVRSEDPEEISQLIVDAQMQSGATLIHLDATGVGFGFVGDLRRRLPNVAIMPFVAAAQADDKAQFVNRRAEAHWFTREALRKHLLDFSEMESPGTLIKELTSARYMLKKGKIQVELKDDIRKRIGQSPDDADALHLCVLPPSGSGAPAPATIKSPSRARKATAESRDQDVLVQSSKKLAAGYHEQAPRKLGLRRSRSLRAR
jgi:hypothetical protein